MQKVINVLALSSALVSLAVVGSGVYVFANKDAIVDKVQSQVLTEVQKLLPDLISSTLPYTGEGGLPGIGEGGFPQPENQTFPDTSNVVPEFDSRPDPSSLYKLEETMQETAEERQERRTKVGLGDNVTISTVDGNSHLR